MPQTSHTLEKEIRKPIRLNYLLHVPEAAKNNPSQKWPLILFLHGSGERGDDVDLVRLHGLPKVLDTRPGFPFIVVSPQCPADTTWSDHLDALIALLDEIVAANPVDAERVYLTGLSMGGSGTWHLATIAPERFAAIAPVCGGDSWYIGSQAPVRSLRNMPVWVFHGALDTVVPITASARIIASLRDFGGDPRFTIYEDVEHNSWNRAYATQELYDWFLSHRRSR